MSKKKIAMLVIAVLGAMLIGTVLLYLLITTLRTSVSPLTSEHVSDARIALKGALGEAIFSGQHGEVIPDAELEGKTGLDALLAPTPGGGGGEGLIKAYQENPQRFKRYAEMLDTAMNAKEVGEMLLQQTASRPPRTSESLAMEANLRVDAWGNPFCIIPVGARIAVVSGGPTRLSCDALPLTAAQIAGSHKNIYAGPSGIVVVIAAPQDAGHTLPAPTQK